MKLARRLFISTFVAALPLLTTGCSSNTEIPPAASSDLPGVSTTAPQGSIPNETLPNVTLTIPTVEGESAQEVLERVQQSGDVKASDLRYLLLSNEGYEKALSANTGIGAISSEGEITVASLSAASTAGLGAVVGYSRTFDTESAQFALREDVYMLSSDESAATFATRYITELKKAQISESTIASVLKQFPKGALGTPSFVAEYQLALSGNLRECHSVAVSTFSKVVAVVTVDRVNCLITTATWSATLAKEVTSRAQSVAGR